MFLKIPPLELVEHGTSVCRGVQHEGEFIIIFPKAYTCRVDTGFNITESLHCASRRWITTGIEAAMVKI